MSAHTPGPWDVWDGPAYVGGGADLCIGAGNKWLANMNERECVRRDCHMAACMVQPDINIVSLGHQCECEGPCAVEGHITEEQRANASLISAAPELLAALKDALDGEGDMTAERIATWRAAVAKAEPR